MAGAARKMWRFLRPGGQLAITTWRSGSLEPLHTVFWEAVRRKRPELYKPAGARSRLAEPGAVERLFAEASITGLEIAHEDRAQLIESAEDWWTIAMGTGYRGTIDRLTPEERDRVRAECLALPAPSVRLPVTYAIARR